MKKLYLPFVLLSLILTGCLESTSSMLTNPAPKSGLDEKTVIAGLKEALNVGTKNAVSLVSKADGYYKNPRISIPLPKDLKDVADTLKKIGLQKKVDEFVETLNRAAEKAAPKAVDIFVDAVTKMTVQDAMGILKGKDDEATRYFERKTRQALYEVFKPVVKKVLDEVGVTKLYKEILNAYNSIPGTKKISFDLDDYATNKALDGLFVMLADEEKKIRRDPAARVTDLLRKVFGSV